MKEKYTQKVAFLNGLQPWSCKQILQKHKVSKTCQELLKVVECMENDYAYPKRNLTSTKNSKGGSSQGKGGLHKEKKRKWEKPPHNNKGKELP
jgi:hypothetical protein